MRRRARPYRLPRPGDAAPDRRLHLALIVVLACTLSPAAASGEWISLATGADVATFRVDQASPAGDSTIVVLRIDPEHWMLRLYCRSEAADQPRMTARKWCERYGLVAATNAGMFATDHTTHVGYLRSGAHINNSHRNRYQSVAAFCPREETTVSFRMFDLDVTPFESILEQYACIAQNLRLIKRPGENRWPQQPTAILSGQPLAPSRNAPSPGRPSGFASRR